MANSSHWRFFQPSKVPPSLWLLCLPLVIVGQVTSSPLPVILEIILAPLILPTGRVNKLAFQSFSAYILVLQSLDINLNILIAGTQHFYI